MKTLVSIVGPTGVGKTKVAIALANKFDTEIISADSRQLFREMTIGTAKPSEEELWQVKHHFINLLSIFDGYDAGMFEADGLATLRIIFQKKSHAIMVGGSGLYCKAIWEGLDDMPKADPEIRRALKDELANRGLKSLLVELARKDPEYYRRVDRSNHQRIIRALEVIRLTGRPFGAFHGCRKAERPFRNIKIGLEIGREEMYGRIDRRVDEMIDDGLFEEAAGLYAQRGLNALETVGYSEVFGYLDNQYDYTEAVRLLKRNSRRYAKRQLTWFKKDGSITWFKPWETEKIKKHLSACHAQ